MMSDNRLDEILNDPIFELTETERKLYDLPDAIKKGRSKKQKAEEVAQRMACGNFADYAHLFDEVRRDLREGRRSLVRYREENIQEDGFFIADGLMGFIASLDVNQRQIKDRVRKDGRSRVIYEDGTESNILFRTIGKNITRNGYIITAPNDGHELDALAGADITEDDEATGWIYILSSLSEDEPISSVKDLYKIGFTCQPIEQRIRNARKETTYLMADVRVVGAYRIYNVDAHRLETLIHHFFDTARFKTKFYDEDGCEYEPKEWYVVPLQVVREAIAKFQDGSIVDYTYNREQQALERSVFDTPNRQRTPKVDTTGMLILSLNIKQVYFNQILSGEKTVEYLQIRATTLNRLTFIDKETGQRFVRQPNALRLYCGYKRDRDTMLVSVQRTTFIEPDQIEYHLGPVLEYDVKTK